MVPSGVVLVISAVEVALVVVLGILTIYAAELKAALSVTSRAGHPLGKVAAYLGKNIGEPTPVCAHPD